MPQCLYVYYSMTGATERVHEFAERTVQNLSFDAFACIFECRGTALK